MIDPRTDRELLDKLKLMTLHESTTMEQSHEAGSVRDELRRRGYTRESGYRCKAVN